LEPWKRLGIYLESIISILELTLEPAWNWLGIEFGTRIFPSLVVKKLYFDVKKSIYGNLKSENTIFSIFSTIRYPVSGTG